MVTFSFGMTPLQGLYPAEVLTFENRAKGLSLQGWTTSLSSLINTFGLPPALGKIGYISKIFPDSPCVLIDRQCTSFSVPGIS
jgi:hypothetical protein